MIKNMKLHPLNLFLLVSLSRIKPAWSEQIDNEQSIEKIEVKGSYLQGYNAHSASGASRLE